MQQIVAVGHIRFDAVPAKWQRVFVTAHDGTPEWHIRMQGAFQEFTDSAISKTCNFPQEATEEDAEQIYRLAFQLGCKGVTVYRDGAREGQVLSTGSTAKKVQEQAAEAGPGKLAEALGRLAELEAELERTRAQLHEVEAENLQRRAKRSRPDLLRGMTRRIETWMQEKQGVQQDLLAGTGAAAVPARELIASQDGAAVLRARDTDQDFIGACPDCGSQLAFIEGCAKCHVCGFSECG